VPLSELVQCVADKRPFPERAVAITFDDGYRDNFVHALPSLRRNGLPALVYVTTNGIGNGWEFWLARMRAILSSTTVTQLNVPGLGTLDLARAETRTRAMSSLMLHFKSLPLDDAYAMLDAVGRECGVEGPVAGAESWIMSWEELRAMRDSGVEIGAHTCRHPILTRQSMAVARDEIERSHKVLREGLGVAPMHFAYPNGSGVINHDDRTARLVQDAGFASASTSINGPLRRDAERYRLHRVGVSRHSAFDGFVFNLERDRFSPRRSLVAGGKQNR
jgi:peptidoglycan/xylan/chitin deacetylase (PgdA/CDA1 family)